MRPIHVLLGLIVVLASGASAYVGAHLASTSAPAAPEIALQAAGDAGASSKDSAALEARKNHDEIAMLSAQVDSLKNELESLRSAASRAPVASPVAPVADPAAVGKVTELDRQTVLAVLEENRQREIAEAAALQAKTEQENAKRRAARVAKDLNLSPGDEARLGDLMYEGRKKGQEMFESMRNGGGDRETLKTQFESLRTWQTDQYTQAFGASIAEQIMQSEGGDRFFGGGPGAGGFAGGAGGGGGQQGRGARRANATGAAGGIGAPGGGQTQQN